MRCPTDWRWRACGVAAASASSRMRSRCRILRARWSLRLQKIRKCRSNDGLIYFRPTETGRAKLANVPSPRTFIGWPPNSPIAH